MRVFATPWKWKTRLLPEEFSIDEQPLEVWLPRDLQRAPERDDARILLPVDEVFGRDEADGETEAAAGGGGGEPEETPDLLAQLSQVLIEQENLARKAKALESRPGGKDEFGRFVRQLLPFLDNYAHLLDLAREHPPSQELSNWLGNIEALYFRLVSLLESYDLRFINSMGKVVDFDLHDVIEYRRTDRYPHNTIIKELQKGVVFRDRLLREAKVVVACNE